MRGIKFVLIVMLAVGTLLAALGAARFRQGDDDYAIINQLTTMKQRKDFFRALTPERKSALWRKHYATELAKHPELTADQKAVVDLAMVIASTDLFRDNLPEPCGPGSVFRTAGENAFRDAFALRREIFGQPAEPLPKFAHANKSDDELPACRMQHGQLVGSAPLGFIQQSTTSWCNSCSCLSLCSRLGCKSEPSGCGCFWQSSCNTLCSSCW